MQNNPYKTMSHLMNEEMNQDLEKFLHPSVIRKKRYFVTSDEINQDIDEALHACKHKKKKCLTLSEEINQDIDRALRGINVEKGA